MQVGSMKSFFMQLWSRWVRLSKKIGDFQARLLLGIVYVLFVLPMGCLLRLVSDPLRLKPGSASHWVARDATQPRLEEAKRQF